MTVLDTRGARGAINSTTVRYLVGMFLVLIGVILGLGIARWSETANSDAVVTYVGPSVERSLAMEQSHDVLEEWGRAQVAALSGAGSVTYVGPSVERSLAMEQSQDVLEEWGRAQASALASGSDSGPLVERSLAMEQSHELLEEWGRVHAELLAPENG